MSVYRTLNQTAQFICKQKQNMVIFVKIAVIAIAMHLKIRYNIEN